MAITIVVVDRGLCPWRIFRQKDIILFLGQVEGRLEGVRLKDEWRGRGMLHKHPNRESNKRNKEGRRKRNGQLCQTLS